MGNSAAIYAAPLVESAGLPLPRWLDRIWLVLIAIAFAVMAPLLVLVWGERLGWWNLGLIVLLLFLIGLWRGWPTDDSGKPSPPGPP
jgi:hypothetical protein